MTTKVYCVRYRFFFSLVKKNGEILTKNDYNVGKLLKTAFICGKIELL